MAKKFRFRDRRDRNFSSDDLSVCRLNEIGGLNASADIQRFGPVTPKNSGRGRRVSIVSLDVLLNIMSNIYGDIIIEIGWCVLRSHLLQ